jgi:hypothetical protein
MWLALAFLLTMCLPFSSMEPILAPILTSSPYDFTVVATGAVSVLGFGLGIFTGMASALFWEHLGRLLLPGMRCGEAVDETA